MKRLHAKLALALVLTFVLCATPLFAQEQQDNGKDKNYGIRIISVDPSLSGLTGIISTLVADTLPQGDWAYGLSYHNWDRDLTDFDVNQFALSIAFGILDNLEIGASMVAYEQIGFAQPPSAAIYPPHVLTSYPFPISTIEEGMGSLVVSAKYAFLQDDGEAPGVALRGFVKFPTGDEKEGFGSGATDFGGDLILSKHVGDSLLLTGNIGYAVLGTPDAYKDFSFGNEVRWGVGAKYFFDKNFRLMGEFTGVNAMDDDDFPQRDIVDLLVGGEYKWENGVRLGAGYTRSLLFDTPSEDPNGAFVMFTFSPWRGMKEQKEAQRREEEDRARVAREEEHRKQEAEQKRAAEERKRTEEAAAAQAAAEKAATEQAAAEKAASEKAAVEQAAAEQAAAEKAAAEEADRTADHTTPEAITKTSEKETADNTVTGLTNILFAFDSSELRASEVEKLNAAVAYLNNNPMQNIVIEGHCCYIGTDEYNLALGESRANAIRAYLLKHGIADTRLSVISYGESRPAFDNSKEETRRFNRRGHFTIKVN